VFHSAFFEDGERGFGDVCLLQVRFALIAADGDKMSALAAIELRREAGIFAIDRHTEEYIPLCVRYGLCRIRGEGREAPV